LQREPSQNQKSQQSILDSVLDGSVHIGLKNLNRDGSLELLNSVRGVSEQQLPEAL